MPTYSVRVPITGYAVVEVEADDEDAAIEAAVQKDLEMQDIEEWEHHQYVVRGNVFYGRLNEADAEQVD